jgi:hypothetical protein
MPRPHRYAVQHEKLFPSWPGEHEDYLDQVEAMHEIRELTNEIARSYRRRDERLYELAMSNRLSREDMARAAGLTKARIDQIVRELAASPAGEPPALVGPEPSRPT